MLLMGVVVVVVPGTLLVVVALVLLFSPRTYCCQSRRAVPPVFCLCFLFCHHVFFSPYLFHHSAVVNCFCLELKSFLFPLCWRGPPFFFSPY